MNIAGTALVLFTIFGLIARPLASYMFTVDAVESLFAVSKNFDSDLNDVGHGNDQQDRPISLSCSSCFQLFLLTKVFCCCAPFCKFSDSTRRLVRLHDRSNALVAQNFSLKNLSRQIAFYKMMKDEKSLVDPKKLATIDLDADSEGDFDT